MNREVKDGKELLEHDMDKLRSKVLAAVLILALVAAAVVVKLKFFPSVKEDYFALSNRSLQQVSSGLVVVRPTRFPKTHFNGIVSTTVPVHGKPTWRMMGRNVTFKELMAAAYGQNAGRVVVPWDAPKTNFDFLVTVRDRQRPRLQEAIRKQLGFVAHMERHNTEVLALKVENANLPGLAVSDPDKKEDVAFKDGKLQFTHVQLGAMTGGLEQALRTPVVDKTGLTNHYDFSLAWDTQILHQLQNGPTARTAVDKILTGWGLALKPDTVTLEMLVVKRADSISPAKPH
jgi:uncharacterized protein (TIGR03435 family)